jgi:hypothetical protein
MAAREKVGHYGTRPVIGKKQFVKNVVIRVYTLNNLTFII